MYIFLFFFIITLPFLYSRLYCTAFFSVWSLANVLKHQDSGMGEKYRLTIAQNYANFQCSLMTHYGIYCNDKQVSVSHHQILLPIIRLAIILLNLSPYHCHQNSRNVRISSSINFCRTRKSISTYIIALLVSSHRPAVISQLRPHYWHTSLVYVSPHLLKYWFLMINKTNFKISEHFCDIKHR